MATIRTDLLTESDLIGALPPGCKLTRCDHSNGRQRNHTYRVTMRAWYRTNGAYSHPAAWDDWGLWLARLFEMDEQLIFIGAARDNGRDSFHARTNGRYLPGLIPAQRSVHQGAPYGPDGDSLRGAMASAIRDARAAALTPAGRRTIDGVTERLASRVASVLPGTDREVFLLSADWGVS